MKLLYFDMDGTLVDLMTSEIKSKLANGAFENAVRAAGFERLVFVGNAIEILNFHEQRHDGHEIILGLGRGACTDEAWFRRTCSWIDKPGERAAAIDLEQDWWYVDDLAESYLTDAGREAIFKVEIGHRVLVPAPRGDGGDVLDWLESSMVGLKPRPEEGPADLARP
jgi:hypothetical protein